MGLLNPTPEEADDGRAFRLVGEFMWHWSVLESALNVGVHKLCNLTSLQAYVVTANMGVRDKIHTVRTMLYICHLSDEEGIKANNKLMDRVTAGSTDRNHVAHTAFNGHPEGVSFLVIKAKGKFEVPDSLWTTKDFAAKNSAMMAMANELKAAVANGVDRRRRILQPKPTQNALAGLSDLNPLLRSVLETQWSNSTSGPETPLALRESPKGLLEGEK